MLGEESKIIVYSMMCLHLLYVAITTAALQNLRIDRFLCCCLKRGVIYRRA